MKYLFSMFPFTVNPGVAMRIHSIHIHSDENTYNYTKPDSVWLFAHMYTPPNLCFRPSCNSVLLQQLYQNNLNLHHGKPCPNAVPWPVTKG